MRLLEEVPSVDWTYCSNHTLRALQLPHPTNSAMVEMDRCIASAISVNGKHGIDSRAAGRAKVIQSQLNSRMRMNLCCL